MKLSKHNGRFVDLFESLDLENYFLEYLTWNTGFAEFCRKKEEFGCILANVDEPLNFTMNRPCINLTQIGDRIILIVMEDWTNVMYSPVVVIILFNNVVMIFTVIIKNAYHIVNNVENVVLIKRILYYVIKYQRFEFRLA